jgi:hypothetical protein
MQILSVGESDKVLGIGPVKQFFEGLASRLGVPSAFALPADSGRKSALARLISALPGSVAPLVLWITGWGVWCSATIRIPADDN